MMSFSGKTGRWGLILSGVAALFPLATALAIWSLPTNAPVGRLVTNVTKYVQEHPNDAQGYYVLGRIHSVAFAKKSRTVSIWTRRDPLDERVLPNVASDYRQNDRRRFNARDRREPAPTREEFLKHLGASVAAYERAIELDASPAHYYLGLAYIIEIGASLAEEVAGLPRPAGNKPTDKQTAEIQKLIAALGDGKTPIRAQAAVDLRSRLDQAAPILHRHPVDATPHVKEAVHELLRAYWRERAIAHYFSAFDRSIDKDLTIEARPMSGLRILVGYEAGTAFVRLVKSRGVRDDVERGRLVFIESAIETLEAVPPSGAITPDHLFSRIASAAL